MNLTQLARHFGVTKQAVDQWVRRRSYNGFPPPVGEKMPYERTSKYSRLRTTLYDVAEVERWRDTYRPVTGAAAHHNRSRQRIL